QAAAQEEERSNVCYITDDGTRPSTRLAVPARRPRCLPGRCRRGLLARNREQHLRLPGNPLLALLRAWRAAALRFDAAAERVHEIDHLGGGALLRALDLLPGLLLLQQVDQGVLVTVGEFFRIEMARLGADDVRGELQHVLRDLFVGNVVEVLGL